MDKQQLVQWLRDQREFPRTPIIVRTFGHVHNFPGAPFDPAPQSGG